MALPEPLRIMGYRLGLRRQFELDDFMLVIAILVGSVLIVVGMMLYTHARILF